ncbi:two-component system LytT family response regulator [Flavobacterium sp. PL11]|uniref:LytR/AlgR family response regulator transcription factor n=1 Tax=Flavobacterium sp. PL11 TaxID=3071717 RepID=UPI002DFCC71B|nr:two-component system LytT family response regulator [Flavobacterium sp. PL11]
MKIKCVLIDDEPLATKILVNYFTNFENFEIIGVYHNPIEALDFVNNNDIDVVFLDLQMPIITGFELIRLIENKTKFVITTAFREFAAESYELNVLDYLVKPIPLSRFIRCIHKIESDFNYKNNIKIDTLKIDPHIFIKVDKKMVKIVIEEILFIEGMKEYIKVVTADKIYVTHKSLTALSEELALDLFIRIHKSYIIAIDKVKSIEGNRIQINSYTLPIGRNFSKEVKSKILK